MQHLTTPLELSAAAWRVVGYMMETNLRVAQVIGQAVIETNPFAVGTGLKSEASKNAPAPKSTAKPAVEAKPSKPAAAKAKAARSATPKAKPAPAPKAARPDAPKPGSTKAPVGKSPENAENTKRPRVPSKPPAMPEASSAVVSKPKTPVN